MKVPSKIDPCPITEAVMEVRYETNIDEAAVFGVIYSQIKSDFSNILRLPVIDIPDSIRKADPALKHLPHFRLTSNKNRNVLIQVGPKSFSVILTNEYPGWNYFLENINYGLQELESSGVISRITRLALRYINFFEENIFPKSTLTLSLGGEPIKTKSTNVRLEIPDGDFLNILTVNYPVIKPLEGRNVIGSLIDIDTIMEGEIPNFSAEKSKLLEACHLTEKKLFSSLLSEKYVNSLKSIQYA